MVYRVFVEKKPGFDLEAKGMLADLKSSLGIEGLKDVRMFNRYDAENMSKEQFDYAVKYVFSEPQMDVATEQPDFGDAKVFAVEFLPGQFDQRADSAAQCIQLIFQGERPLTRSARVYALYGDLSDADVAAVKKYVINPVEAREAAAEKPETLVVNYDIPTEVATVEGFIDMTDEDLAKYIADNGLAMDEADLMMVRNYFASEHRDPTITEIKMIDTYWSDHCRHTTFNTVIDGVTFEDELLQNAWNDYMNTRKFLHRTKPICLMDLATIAVKQLKSEGKMDKLDESEEINACTIKITVNIDGKEEPWLLLFKNETHNHPTEIEPFGGAATCTGGCIRDPLSGRAYVYAAMRVSGAADPTRPLSEALPGKIPQKRLTQTAAAGNSSYGNQIGLPAGIVDEIYHPGYVAKRMELGAVIAAAPAENVRREVPAPGDVVILLGGGTGRDGIGGATGASKAHDVHSVETCGAEVQKGNAPEERKMQRLFRNGEATRLIKRCNDFGAGGVSVAIGELADGLDINLDLVPKKYEGLDGTELAISESQERMACCVAAKDVEKFLALAAEENLNAVPVAKVTDTNRLVMHWNGKTIVDISRSFLNTNGADKHITVAPAPAVWDEELVEGGFVENLKNVAGDLNSCSRRGMVERFDSNVGAATVLSPFGGKYQRTPIQAMVHKVSVEKDDTDTCSLMAFGFNPFISSSSPYHGAYLAVVESCAKLVAAGAEFKDVYLSLQEYFEKLGKDPKRWGKPLAALLGAFEAQMALGVGAIGGKDSMSGTFENLDVPPTLVSFAVTTDKVDHICGNEFKAPGHKVVWIRPELNEAGLPTGESLLKIFGEVTELLRSGKACTVYTPGMGGVAAAIMKMAFGNQIGFSFADDLDLQDVFATSYGSFIVEMADGYCEKCAAKVAPESTLLGVTTDDGKFTAGEESVTLEEIAKIYESRLEDVFPCNIPTEEDAPVETFTSDKKCTAAPAVKVAKPRVLIPAFPGTNSEYDSAKYSEAAGAEAKICVIRNLTPDDIQRSVEEVAEEIRRSQMIFIPGGFSGGDEPDGSGKFITAFFRNAAIKEAVTELLEKRDGLMLGVCNGFQALVKLGLVPYGKIIDTDENCPTVTFNKIGRLQSKIVRTRVCSVMSPWLAKTQVGDVYNVAISHGEGRFYASDELIHQLAANGQIAQQYVGLDGEPSMSVDVTPNGSAYAIEGITSPDGRVFGKMGHIERYSKGIFRNIPGNYDPKLMEAAVEYFTK